MTHTISGVLDPIDLFSEIPMTFCPRPGGPEYNVVAHIVAWNPISGQVDFEGVGHNGEVFTFSLTPEEVECRQAHPA